MSRSPRSENTPGELSVKLSYGQIMGDPTVPYDERIVPHLQITDATSGATLSIEMDARQFTEFMSGSNAAIRVDQVSGLKGLSRWGLYHHVTSKLLPGRDTGSPEVLDYVAALEADGWATDSPRTQREGVLVVGRKYLPTPKAEDE